MLFSRRKPLSPKQRFQGALWPRRGWLRAMRYTWLRTGRLQGSPHAIALGVSAGIFATFVPILGIQMGLAAALAYALRGNLLGALAGTFVGTPVTYPLMWFGSYRLGGWLLGHDPGPLKQGLDRWWSLVVDGYRGDPGPAAEALWPIVLPLLMGSLVLGLAAGTAAYYTLLHSLARLQTRRRAQLAVRVSARRLAAA
jgi:uncharacterized protein